MRVQSARCHWLSEEGALDVAVVGGKAAGLACLATRHRVPDGFVVLPDVDGEQLDEALEECYAELACRVGQRQPRVAVRSSAVDGDGLTAPSAGRYETVLAVRGIGGVRTAIERCRASAATTRALAYHAGRRVASTRCGMPVLVQHLVAADVSAVARSANPTTRDASEIVVTASYGLGDSVVSGTTAPDTWRVRRRGLAIVDWRLGAKARMTVPTAQGVREVDVPDLQRGVASLDDARVLEIARLALALEQQAGRPVDVECAFAGRTLHLLQSRPLAVLDRRAS
jgi:phosphoenolpyruvate synthase/pyruvate phosphate dikinase